MTMISFEYLISDMDSPIKFQQVKMTKRLTDLTVPKTVNIIYISDSIRHLVHS